MTKERQLSAPRVGWNCHCYAGLREAIHSTFPRCQGTRTREIQATGRWSMDFHITCDVQSASPSGQHLVIPPWTSGNGLVISNSRIISGLETWLIWGSKTTSLEVASLASHVSQRISQQAINLANNDLPSKPHPNVWPITSPIPREFSSENLGFDLFVLKIPYSWETWYCIG